MTRRVLAVVSDLFFATKIAATAEAAGVALETLEVAAALARLARTPDDASARADGGASPSLVLLDLGAGEPAIAVARALRARPDTATVPIVGFFPHVDTATRDAAIAAGVDPVMPRSAFVARLPVILAAGIGTPPGGGGYTAGRSSTPPPTREHE